VSRWARSCGSGHHGARRVQFVVDIVHVDVQLVEAGIRRDAAHRRRLRPGPHRHRARLYTVDYSSSALHPAARERTRPCPPHHLKRRLDDRHHAGRRRGHRGADRGQRRRHQRREDLHVPHQAGRGLGLDPGAAGHVAGLPARVQGLLQPGQPGREPDLLRRGDRRHDQYCNAETAYFANAKSHAPTAANIANFQNTHNISGHHRAELDDDPVHPDVAGQRLPVHDGDAVRLGPAGGVRQLRAEQPAAGPAHALRRAVPDQLLHPRQVDHAGQEPGLEAVHRLAPARLRQRDRGDARRRPPPRPSWPTCRPAPRT
jgi:hypothetical protein